MMEKRRWSWKRKSSEKIPGETESSGSASSHSERYSDEQQEALKESPTGSNQLPDVTSKAVASAEDVNDRSFINEQSPEVTSHTTDNINVGLYEEDENGSNDNIINIKEGDVTDGLRNMSEKLSAALVNVSAKEDLVKQHAKVAEEAIAGWEKAENEVAVLKKQLEALTLRNSALEDRVTHLDGALKECVRQLRQTREEQEQNARDAVVKKTHDLESAKIKLENQLLELQSKLEDSNARSPSSIDLDKCQKVGYLEKENMALKHELLAQSEELEIRTIERDLSTQAAETASKQHLDSIKKEAKLEAECLRLKSMACRASLVNGHTSITPSSFCVESSIKNDLMDDFLEMERLAALPETKNESFIQELVGADQCINEESSLRDEFDIMNLQMNDLKEKLEKAKAEKAELEIALMKSEECIEASQLQLREAETKLEELQRELKNAYKSKQMIGNQLMSMEAEAQSITAKVQLLEADVDKERAISDEIAIKWKELEEELESKKQEEKLWSIATSCGEMKIKQEDLALAAGKLAECQKTIASLGNQLTSLATLEDFLIDTASIPEFSASPSLIARDYSSTRLVDGSSGPSSNKNAQSSPPSLSSSATLPIHFNSEKSRNGFANFFSQTKCGIRLEI